MWKITNVSRYFTSYLYNLNNSQDKLRRYLWPHGITVEGRNIAAFDILLINSIQWEYLDLFYLTTDPIIPVGLILIILGDCFIYHACLLIVYVNESVIYVYYLSPSVSSMRWFAKIGGEQIS